MGAAPDQATPRRPSPPAETIWLGAGSVIKARALQSDLFSYHLPQEQGPNLGVPGGATLSCVIVAHNEQCPRRLPQLIRSPRRCSSGAVFLCGQFLVAYGLRVLDGTVGSFGVVRVPEMKDDAIGLSGGLGYFLGFLR